MKRSTDFIGERIKVTIDRPIGSIHPKFSNLKYEINYGFVPGIISGDGEEIDAYVLGEKEELKEFEGKCIAVIQRQDQDDDKLVVTRDDLNYSDQEIEELTYFQEQYFTSKIERKKPTTKQSV